MICPNCGSIQSNGASSCTICGYEFDASKAKPKSIIPDDTKQFSLAKLYYEQNNMEQFQQVVIDNEFNYLKTSDKEELSELIISSVDNTLPTENWLSAEPLLIKALNLNPKKREQVHLLLNRFYYLKGTKLYDSDEREEALDNFLLAKSYGNTETDKFIVEIRYDSAKQLIGRKKLRAALSELQECLEIDPTNTEYLKLINDTELKLKETKKATIRLAGSAAIGIFTIFLALFVYNKFLTGQVSIHLAAEDHIIKSTLPPLAEIVLKIDGKEHENWGSSQPLRTSAARHIIEIQHDSYEKFVDTVKVKAGRINEITFRLTPKLADITIHSNPEGARIFIVNNYIGETPKAVKIPLGTHQLVLMKSDYQDKQQILEIKGKEPLEFNIKLDKITQFGLVSADNYNAEWVIEPGKIFSSQGEPLYPEIAELINLLETREGEGTPVSRLEFIEMLRRPEAQIIYQNEIIKYATPASLAIQKREHENYTKIFMRENYQKAGLDFIRNQHNYLEHAERVYGVLQRDIVSVLIWESGLGKFTGNYQEFNVFLGQILFLDLAQKTAVDKMIAEGQPNPLEDTARAQKERTRLQNRKNSAVANLAALLRVCKKSGLDPFAMKGSWGGAIGYVQFMPANLKYAVDGDADGKVNISQWPDAIMSVGNYLRTLGKYETSDAGRNRALLRYNPSKEYAAGVMLLADTIWQRHLNGE